MSGEHSCRSYCQMVGSLDGFVESPSPPPEASKDNEASEEDDNFNDDDDDKDGDASSFSTDEMYA